MLEQEARGWQSPQYLLSDSTPRSDGAGTLALLSPSRGLAGSQVRVWTAPAVHEAPRRGDSCTSLPHFRGAAETQAGPPAPVISSTT